MSNQGWLFKNGHFYIVLNWDCVCTKFCKNLPQYAAISKLSRILHQYMLASEFLFPKNLYLFIRIFICILNSNFLKNLFFQTRPRLFCLIHTKLGIHHLKILQTKSYQNNFASFSLLWRCCGWYIFGCGPWQIGLYLVNTMSKLHKTWYMWTTGQSKETCQMSWISDAQLMLIAHFP